MKLTMTAIRNLHDVSLEFLTISLSETIEVSYFDDGIRAGFPSPANDFQELKISFDKEVFGTSPSTIFCAKVIGDSMKNLGIDSGDTIVVDRILEPQDGDICVAVINNDFTLKTIKIEKDCVWLMPANENYKPLQVTEDDDFSVWGIVTHTLKYHRKRR